MIVTHEFDTVPDNEVRLAWCEWFHRHTIDPDEITVPGFVEVDSDAQRIRYLAYGLNDHGARYSLDGETAVTEIREVQLEACPSAFPV